VFFSHLSSNSARIFLSLEDLSFLDPPFSKRFRLFLEECIFSLFVESSGFDSARHRDLPFFFSLFTLEFSSTLFRCFLVCLQDSRYFLRVRTHSDTARFIRASYAFDLIFLSPPFYSTFLFIELLFTYEIVVYYIYFLSIRAAATLHICFLLSGNSFGCFFSFYLSLNYKSINRRGQSQFFLEALQHSDFCFSLLEPRVLILPFCS